jgi:outer membrane protein assembly factor BamB
MVAPHPTLHAIRRVLIALVISLSASPALADDPAVRIAYRVGLAEQGFFAFGALETAGPTLSPDGQRLVVGTSKGDLFLFDAATAEIIVRRKLEGGISAAPVFAGDALWVGTNDGRVYRFRPADLESEWEKPAALKGAVTAPPVLADGVLYVQDDRSVLHALDAATGDVLVELDSQSFARRGLSPFTIYGYPELEWSDGTVFAGFETGFVGRFAPKTEGGKVIALEPRWQVGLCSAGALRTADESGKGALCSPRRVFRDVDSSPTLSDKGLVTGCYCRGLALLAPDDGRVIWETPILGPSGPVVLGRHVAVASADGALYAVRLEDGATEWTTQLGAGLLARPAVLGARGDLASTVLVVTTGDTLFFVDGKSGRITAKITSLGGIAATPATAGSAVFVLSNEGYLYRLDYFR